MMLNIFRGICREQWKLVCQCSKDITAALGNYLDQNPKTVINTSDLSRCSKFVKAAVENHPIEECLTVILSKRNRLNVS